MRDSAGLVEGAVIKVDRPGSGRKVLARWIRGSRCRGSSVPIMSSGTLLTRLLENGRVKARLILLDEIVLLVDHVLPLLDG